MTLDASRIAPHLCQGGRPPTGHGVAAKGFDLLVLCAMEYQPRVAEFHGLPGVIHCPIDDARPTQAEVDAVFRAGRMVADHVRNGERCLVTCQMGLNRSGFVTAIALRELLGASGEACIRRVRAGRNKMGTLSNPWFADILRRLPARYRSFA